MAGACPEACHHFALLTIMFTALCGACDATRCTEGGHTASSRPAAGEQLADSGEHRPQFHVVAEGANVIAPRTPELYPVFLGDSVLLHPSWIALKDDEFAGSGLPQISGASFVFGSSPRLLYTAGMQDDGLVVNSTIDDRVAVARAFKTAESVNYRFTASPWIHGEFLFVASRFGYDPEAVHYAALGGNTPAPPLVLANGERFTYVNDILATEKGAVFVLGAAGSTDLILAYWRPGSSNFARLESDAALHGCRPQHLSRIFDGSVVAMGRKNSSGRAQPCVERFDGTKWQSVDGPDLPGRAKCYAQEPRGIEWLVTEGDSSGTPPGLWSRREAGQWEAVALPDPVLARTRQHGPIEPICVWARRDADIWVQGQYRELCIRGVVLRSVAARRPCRVSESLPDCAASADAEPRGTVCEEHGGQ